MEITLFEFHLSNNNYGTPLHNDIMKKIEEREYKHSVFDDEFGNAIEFYAKDKIAYMNFKNIVFQQFKPFFLLLRGAIETVAQSGVENIQQVVTIEDSKELTGWNIVHTGSEVCTICCEISDCLRNVELGFGLGV